MNPTGSREFRNIISDVAVREALRRSQGKKGVTHRRVASRALSYAMCEHLGVEEALAFVLLCGVAYGHALTSGQLDDKGYDGPDQGD